MTALTPAQVRDHARALILRLGHRMPAMVQVDEQVGRVARCAERDAIYDAIRTARITVDWDEETDAEQFDREDAHP